MNSPSEIFKFQNDVSVTLSWYCKLSEILEHALAVKHNQSQQFKQTLDNIDVEEIVFADLDKHLGCGMKYEIAVLTPSKKFLGQNILGELLSSFKRKVNE